MSVAHQDRDVISRRGSIVAEGADDMQVSDGYHTMDDLYKHRVALFIALARICRRQEEALGERENHPWVWRSKNHSAPDADGKELPMFDGWYVLGIGNFEGQQMTYHLPIETWSETDFATTLEYAPRYDGHTPDDVLMRLKNL